MDGADSRRWMAIAAALFAVAPATAQIVDVPAVLEPDLKAPPMSAVVQYGHQFEADVEDAGTKMARDTAFFGLNQRFKLGERTSLFLVETYTLHAYDFSGRSGPANRYRWDDVHRVVVSGILGHDLNDRWRLLGGAMIRSWGEGGAEFGDTLSGGLLAGFDYHPNRDFSIGLVIGALSQLGGGVGLIPVPMLRWNMAPDWRVNVGMVQLVDPGVGAMVSHDFTPELSLGAGFTFQSRQYRLADKTRVTPTGVRPNRTDDGGIGQETEIPIFALLRYRPTPKIELDLHGGVAVGGNLRVEDEDGGRIRDDDYDPAGLLGIKAQFLF